MAEGPVGSSVMRNFDSFFRERLDDLKTEGRYRTFADLERFAKNCAALILKRSSSSGPAPIPVFLPKSAQNIVADLAALYSGYMTPHELLTAGSLEGSEAELAMAAQIFAGPRPWTPDMF